MIVAAACQPSAAHRAWSCGPDRDTKPQSGVGQAHDREACRNGRRRKSARWPDGKTVRSGGVRL